MLAQNTETHLWDLRKIQKKGLNDGQILPRHALKEMESPTWPDSIKSKVQFLRVLKGWTKIQDQRYAKELHSRFVLKSKRDNKVSTDKHEALFVVCRNVEYDNKEETLFDGARIFNYQVSYQCDATTLLARKTFWNANFFLRRETEKDSNFCVSCVHERWHLFVMITEWGWNAVCTG